MDNNDRASLVVGGSGLPKSRDMLSGIAATDDSLVVHDKEGDKMSESVHEPKTLDVKPLSIALSDIFNVREYKIAIVDDDSFMRNAKTVRKNLLIEDSWWRNKEALFFADKVARAFKRELPQSGGWIYLKIIELSRSNSGNLFLPYEYLLERFK